MSSLSNYARDIVGVTNSELAEISNTYNWQGSKGDSEKFVSVKNRIPRGRSLLTARHFLHLHALINGFYTMLQFG